MTYRTERSGHKSVKTGEGIVVSVITPTRDRPKALRRAMSSVYGQTITDVEHIVLGDSCPFLARPDICEGLADEFPAARIENLETSISCMNYRPARTARVRNHGIAVARGRFIAHLDDDNAFEENHLESLVSALEADSDAVAAHSWRRLFDPDGNPYVPTGFNPWIAEPGASARNYAELADSGVFRVGSNVMRDRIRGRRGQPFMLIDTSELVVRSEFHRIHRFRTHFTDQERTARLCEDRAWCIDVIGLGYRIVASRQATLRYTMGGYSNGSAGDAFG